MSTTPKLVKQNRNTSEPAARKEFRSNGSVTRKNLPAGPAPSIAAESSSRVSMLRQPVAIMRAARATL
ncbi:hypothetical protein D3C83_289000 [compost metagenome]